MDHARQIKLQSDFDLQLWIFWGAMHNFHLVHQALMRTLEQKL